MVFTTKKCSCEVKQTHVSQSYMFYTLKQAVSKFRRDNGLQYKKIVISKLF